jgi:hypothetical protein
MGMYGLVCSGDAVREKAGGGEGDRNKQTFHGFSPKV